VLRDWFTALIALITPDPAIFYGLMCQTLAKIRTIIVILIHLNWPFAGFFLANKGDSFNYS
jgi:hypothetical protein